MSPAKTGKKFLHARKTGQKDTFTVMHPTTVGLASHWPCVTDSVVYPPTGSKANVWEMNTPPMPQGMHGPLFTQQHQSIEG